MAILFSKQYGETLMIVTDDKVTFVRDNEKTGFGFLLCHVLDPDMFNFDVESTDYKRYFAGKKHDNSNARPDESH